MGRPMTAPRPLLRVALGAVLGAAAAGLAGCLDTGLLSDVAFAPQVAGLSPAQPWTALPVDSWIAESGIEPVAISACLSGCEVRAVVARFRARGPDAAILARLVENPAPLLRALSAPPRTSRTSGTGRAKPVPPERRAVATVTRLPGPDAARGLLIHLARPDGTRPAYGAVLATGSPEDLSVLLVVTDTEGATLRLARDAAAAASGG